MTSHDWERRPVENVHGDEIPGKGYWLCMRCGLGIPFHAGYKKAVPGDEFVRDFLGEEPDCHLRVVREVMDS